jgi:DNA adenine methylase
LDGIEKLQKKKKTRMHIANKIKSFQYLGGKFSILPELLPMLPECHHFIDVFGGSAVVTLNRKPSPIETINDINHQVVNFFKMLREFPEELIRSLELTLHSKHEYDHAWESPADSDLEKARKFFVRTQQSIFAAGAQERSKGWAAAITESRVSISEKTRKWLNGVDNLWVVAERLKHTQIECRDFRFVLKNYDHLGALFYCDCPYDMTFRSNTVYTFDFVNQDFYDLHHYAKRVKGKIAISGYDSPFMLDLFSDFNFRLLTKTKNNRSNKDDIHECLWTNY